MIRMLLPALLAAAPAFAGSAPPPGGPEVTVKELVADPGQYVGQRVETEGYVIDRSIGSAQIGDTNRGIIAADTLTVSGPQVAKLNYFDRFRLDGTMAETTDTLPNGSHYELKLAGVPVAAGR